MTIKELVSEIAKREAGKSNVKVGDIREIIGHLSDMVFVDELYGDIKLNNLVSMLYANGKRRAKKAKR